MRVLVLVALVQDILAIFESVWQVLQVLALDCDSLRRVPSGALRNQVLRLVHLELLIALVLGSTVAARVSHRSSLARYFEISFYDRTYLQLV